MAVNIFNGLNNNTQGLSGLYKYHNTIQDTSMGNTMLKTQNNFQQLLQKNEYNQPKTLYDNTRYDNTPYDMSRSYEKNQHTQKNTYPIQTPKKDPSYTPSRETLDSKKNMSNTSGNIIANNTDKSMASINRHREREIVSKEKENRVTNNKDTQGKDNANVIDGGINSEKEVDNNREQEVRTANELLEMNIDEKNSENSQDVSGVLLDSESDDINKTDTNETSHNTKEDTSKKSSDDRTSKKVSAEHTTQSGEGTDAHKILSEQEKAMRKETGVENGIGEKKKAEDTQQSIYANAMDKGTGEHRDNANASMRDATLKSLQEQKYANTIKGKTNAKKTSRHGEENKDAIKEQRASHENKDTSIDIEKMRSDIETRVFQNSFKEMGMNNKASQHIQSFLKNEGNKEFVQQAKLILQDNKKGEIKLLLNPKEFGEVKLNFNLEDNKIVGKILVMSEVAKDALQKNMDNLERQFNHAGYEVGGFFVSVDSNTAEKNNEGNNKDKSNKKITMDMKHISDELLLQKYIGTRSETIDFVA